MICDEDPLRRRPGALTVRRKRQEGCVWMTENMGKGPPGHRDTEKSGHRMAAEKTLFLRRWYGGIISANLEVIWEMSVEPLFALLTMARTSAVGQQRTFCSIIRNVCFWG